MRVLLGALLLVTPLPAEAESPLVEARAYCEAHPEEAGFWRFFEVDLDGSPPLDLVFPDVAGSPQPWPVQMRVFLAQGSTYRQIGRVPYAGALILTRQQGQVLVQSPITGDARLLQHVNPTPVREYRVRHGRLRPLGVRTIPAPASDVFAMAETWGWALCGASAPGVLDVFPPNPDWIPCSVGIDMEEGLESHRRAVALRERMGELLRPSGLRRRPFLPRPTP